MSGGDRSRLVVRIGRQSAAADRLCEAHGIVDDDLVDIMRVAVSLGFAVDNHHMLALTERCAKTQLVRYFLSFADEDLANTVHAVFSEDPTSAATWNIFQAAADEQHTRQRERAWQQHQRSETR